MSDNTVDIRRIVTNPDTIRDRIHKNIIEALKEKFPIEGNKYRAELKDIRIQHALLSHDKQKHVLLAKGNASDKVIADIDIVNISTGKVVSKLRKHTLMNMPYYTNRFTFIIDGNEYNIVNQLRTKSGIYTRKRGNGELESSFNLKRGANFKLIMYPESGAFKVDIMHSRIPMNAFLEILGAPIAAVKTALGDKLYQVNSKVTPLQKERAIKILFDKLVRYKTDLGTSATKAEKLAKIREYFADTELDAETTKITLGKSFVNVNYQAVLEAAKKILRVYNSSEDIDERDNLEFQKIYSAEDIVAEVMRKNSTGLMKIKSKLDNLTFSGDTADDQKKLKAAFSPAYLSKPLRTFLTTSSISRLPGQINPLEIIDGASIVTRLGEGAISSETAVPEETRAVNYSYMGVIDPIATPESSKIGIDNRFTIAALKGSDNELYKELIDVKSGKTVRKRLIEVQDKTIGMPIEKHRKASIRGTDVVPAVKGGKLTKVKYQDLDYVLPSVHSLSSIAVNALPFVNANQANRIVMGSKHLQQALPLKDRDTRLVETVINEDGKSVMDIVGGFMLPKAPVSGTVHKVDSEFIYIKDAQGNTHKVEYSNNLPLATKTMLNNEVTVAVGDKVTKGQPLADNNFTKDNRLALGKNLQIAYMPYFGMNHEDGVVISQAAAKKLTSVHADKITVTLDNQKVLDKQKYASYFPTEFSAAQLSKLDDRGVVKKGVTVNHGDPLILVLGNNTDSRANQVLGNLHKSLVREYRDESEVYEGSYPAKVLEVHTAGKTTTVLLEVEKPASIGDKVSGSYGNKGVITKIVPDEEMIQDEEGKPLDVLFTSAGVIGRINPAQILESTLGKIAAKTGKPYKVENFSSDDYTKLVRDEMKKHNISDKETVTDPKTGKKIPGIFVGTQHVHKLFKTTDTNFSARGIDGPYDQDGAPVGSGELGPKGIGGMEVNALVAHNARNILQESSSLRSSKNTEFWKQFQYGGNPQMPVEKQAFTKFTNILKQGGIKVDKKGTTFSVGPLTDKDVTTMSSGAIRNGLRIDAKLNPEAGGLFDPIITGGIGGEKWSHIDLEEPVINPVFEDCAKALLDLSTKELRQQYEQHGGKVIQQKLNAIDVGRAYAKTKKELDNPKLTGTALDKLVKKFKYLKTLKERGLKAGDAYMLSKIPVTPPSLRPLTIGKSGDIMENDSNLLYRDLILQNNSFKELKAAGISEEDKIANRKALSTRVGELVGTIAPESQHLKNKNVKGALRYIAGDEPKRGYFQRKVVYSKMNMTGRATIAPDNTLGMDEVGLPEDMAWSMYKPFIIKELTRRGYGAIEAQNAVKDRIPAAKEILDDELTKRPVLVNRAPTLWRFSVNAAMPKLRSGKTMGINSLWEGALNADYDGDAMTVHVPITDKAITDAKNILPSNLVFSDRKRGDLIYAPTQEPIVGLYKATAGINKNKAGKVHKFKNVGEAWDAYNSGTLKATDRVDIG